MIWGAQRVAWTRWKNLTSGDRPTGRQSSNNLGAKCASPCIYFGGDSPEDNIAGFKTNGLAHWVLNRPSNLYDKISNKQSIVFLDYRLTPGGRVWLNLV